MRIRDMEDQEASNLVCSKAAEAISVVRVDSSSRAVSRPPGLINKEAWAWEAEWEDSRRVAEATDDRTSKHNDDSVSNDHISPFLCLSQIMDM